MSKWKTSHLLAVLVLFILPTSASAQGGFNYQTAMANVVKTFTNLNTERGWAFSADIFSASGLASPFAQPGASSNFTCLATGLCLSIGSRNTPVNIQFSLIDNNRALIELMSKDLNKEIFRESEESVFILIIKNCMIMAALRDMHERYGDQAQHKTAEAQSQLKSIKADVDRELARGNMKRGVFGGTRIEVQKHGLTIDVGVRHPAASCSIIYPASLLIEE
jgi:hypothetical protein